MGSIANRHGLPGNNLRQRSTLRHVALLPLIMQWLCSASPAMRRYEICSQRYFLATTPFPRRFHFVEATAASLSMTELKWRARLRSVRRVSRCYMKLPIPWSSKELSTSFGLYDN
jgi:hypothetical protein